MHRIAAVLALCCLAGCASTPAEVIAEGPRTEHDLSMTPTRAAGCISRNAENLVDSIRAPIRPLETGDRHEVIIRNLNSDLRPVLMVGFVEPKANASRVTFHGPGFGLHPPRPEFVASLVKGC